ncbi:MAG TPA: fumarylacetoacetate hydrolase family protein [Candidatus Krumholzibacteria bacterium]|nr:fumarylacetoacetate hydrolase family protein [Candidatus Krumholzibacteria bacterium]
MIARIYRLAAAEHPLVLETQDRFLDLSAHLAEENLPADPLELSRRGFFAPSHFAAWLESGDWKEVDPPRDSALELDTPIAASRVGKILALGKNFRAHAAEFGEEVPEEPLFFNKLPELLRPSGVAVSVPSWYEERVDHEAEVAVVIGSEGKEIALAKAMDCVAGYTVANDLTARSLQKRDREMKFPWFRGKNLDGFCPLGPCFVPKELIDISDLHVQARVNGELRQDASTRDWVVDIPHALVYLSRHLTLYPGDLVLMGTPEGVSPLHDGDEVVCSVEGIGELRTTIVRA